MKRAGQTIDKTTSRALDGYLVVAAQAGDRTAFDHLARRWQRRLIAHAWRLTGDGEAARDAVQWSWLEIAQGLGRLRDEQAFPAWAYRIVSRRCARFVTGRQGERALARGLARENAVDPDPFAPAPDPEGPDEARRLHQAIAALPPGQRAALALFHFEEMSVAEVAVALNIPAGTVKTRLMHARRSLRSVLEGDHHA
jgi:RNA polymerase sigma-70 factor (ECF subfamily)